MSEIVAVVRLTDFGKVHMLASQGKTWCGRSADEGMGGEAKQPDDGWCSICRHWWWQVIGSRNDDATEA